MSDPIEAAIKSALIASILHTAFKSLDELRKQPNEGQPVTISHDTVLGCMMMADFLRSVPKMIFIHKDNPRMPIPIDLDLKALLVEYVSMEIGSGCDCPVCEAEKAAETEVKH